jgi:hypothetical protein
MYPLLPNTHARLMENPYSLLKRDITGKHKILPPTSNHIMFFFLHLNNVYIVVFPDYRGDELQQQAEEAFTMINSQNNRSEIEHYYHCVDGLTRVEDSIISSYDVLRTRGKTVPNTSDGQGKAGFLSLLWHFKIPLKCIFINWSSSTRNEMGRSKYYAIKNSVGVVICVARTQKFPINLYLCLFITIPGDAILRNPTTGKWFE